MSSSVTHVESPIGRLALVADCGALTAIHLPAANDAPGAIAVADAAVLRAAAAQLTDYFAGARARFELPLAPGGTPFQRAVWAELARIPHGATTSYAAVALAIGRPRAVRAVGAANGRNPLPIIVPCHRVIGKGGALTGYAGGLPAKRWLLEHEAAG